MMYRVLATEGNRPEAWGIPRRYTRELFLLYLLDCQAIIREKGGVCVGDDEVRVASWRWVTVTELANSVEVQFMEHENRQATIIPLDKSHYYDVGAMQVKEYQTHGETRADNVASLRRTFRDLRRVINANFSGGDNELFITLTYGENMRDVERLYKDFEKFIKRFRYKYGACEYILCVEPQARGAWHGHLLVKWVGRDYVYIPNEEVEKCWGHGFTTTRRLTGVDNVGAYLSVYLSDVSFDEADEAIEGGVSYWPLHDGFIERQGKRYLKGARLRLYPSGMRIYRTSRGIKRPERVRMRYGDIKKKLGGLTPSFRKVYEVERGTFKSRMLIEEYNMKRQGVGSDGEVV